MLFLSKLFHSRVTKTKLKQALANFKLRSTTSPAYVPLKPQVQYATEACDITILPITQVNLGILCELELRRLRRQKSGGGFPGDDGLRFLRKKEDKSENVNETQIGYQKVSVFVQSRSGIVADAWEVVEDVLG